MMVDDGDAVAPHPIRAPSHTPAAVLRTMTHAHPNVVPMAWPITASGLDFIAPCASQTGRRAVNIMA
jgi:hypothetical protein